MKERERTSLRRDCKGTEIPAGYPTIMQAGTPVTILQTLGGNYTIGLDDGRVVRIDASDIDALGMEVAKPEAAAASGPVDEKVVWDELRTIYDPEIPVNIVDLGLVYLCEMKPAPDGGCTVDIRMTMTAPGCGMGGVLMADVESKLRALPGIKDVNVELVWDPPWDQDRMSEAARLQLGMM